MEFEKKYDKAVQEYKSKTPKSLDAYQEAEKYLAGGETRSISAINPYPISLKSAKGYQLIDFDDNEYIDFLSNYTSIIHGHAHPEITKAISEATAQGTISPAGILEQTALAKIMCERSPSVDKIRFCNSGTEATMFAIRVAKAYSGKDGIIKMLGAYHGTHDCVECSIDPGLDSPVEDNRILPVPEPGIPKSAMKDVYIAPYNDLNAVEDILKKYADKIACIIVEPFLGTTGMVAAKPGYLKGLRELADRYNVVYIIDEVQSFRLSTGGAQKKYNVLADLTSFGKFIGGGLPVGAFGGKNEIMDKFNHSIENPLKQSGTFNGNRPTMAGGIVALQLLNEEKILHLELLAERLEAGMEKEVSKRKLPITICREGSLMNVHFTPEKPYDYISAYKHKKDILKLWHLEMMNGGIFSAPRGLFVISTVMDDVVIDRAIDVFANALDQISDYF